MHNSLLRVLCTILCLSLVACNDYVGILLLRTYIPRDINNKGDVLIEDEKSAGPYVFKKGSYYKITPPAGIDVAYGVAINDNGDVLGWGYSNSRDTKLFVCRNETCEELPVPQEWDDVKLQNMNNKGMVVGWAEAANYDIPGLPGSTMLISAFIYSNGVYIELPLPVECTDSSDGYSIFINDSDEVVFTYSCDLQVRTYLYKDGHSTELNLPGLTGFKCRGISNNGIVLLYATDNTSQQARSFMYSAGQYTELLPPGLEQATAWQINDSGVAVGEGYDSAGTRKWFMYDGKKYTIRTPLGILKNKDDVFIGGFNNNGVIVGQAFEYFFDSPWLALSTSFIAVPRFAINGSNKKE